MIVSRLPWSSAAVSVTRNLIPFAALAALAASSGACSSVRSSTRDGSSGLSRDAALVKVVTEGAEGPWHAVSFSAWDVDLVDDLPAKAPEDVINDMREEAADNGAEMLIVERYEDAYRKAFYGWGAVADQLAPKDPPVCGHPGFSASLEKAKEKARSCAAILRQKRPALMGSVDVVFEVDPEGNVLRAAPTPNSSRDSELQACVLEAVHESGWGIPLQFSCQARIAVDIAP